METILISLAGGLVQAFEPLNLLMIVIGCTVGLFVGAMPGLGSVNGVAILLPITFLVPPTAAIIFLAAVYYGAMYGGAISSITLGIPGASTAVATVFDGRPLAMSGKADQALTAAAIASFIGGTISVVLFTLFAPPLAEFALKFGPPEEFALIGPGLCDIHRVGRRRHSQDGFLDPDRSRARDGRARHHFGKAAPDLL